VVAVLQRLHAPRVVDLGLGPAVDDAAGGGCVGGRDQGGADVQDADRDPSQRAGEELAEREPAPPPRLMNPNQPAPPPGDVLPPEAAVRAFMERLIAVTRPCLE